jgi:hypothetical protein
VRITALSALLAASLTALAIRQHVAEPVLGPPLTWWAHAAPPGPTVIFVVLDAVRADHLSLCGYERPTSPNLARLQAEGAAVTCDAVSPGAWTVPSHATYFTGVDTPVHKADFGDLGHDTDEVLVVRSLGTELPTLAEQLRAQGYQTAAVTANPMLPAAQLLRGFETVDAATSEFDDAPALLDRLRDVLRFRVVPDKPLFLFVNVGDAHDPWEGVPPGLPWAAPTGPYRHDRGGSPDSPFARLIEQKMGPAEKAAFLGRLRDLYDVGVRNADQALADLLRVLAEHGWLDAGYRLVVVSDHGEHLGERDLLDHGRFTTEEAVRVPILVFQQPMPPAGITPVPKRLWAGHVFELVRDGHLPASLVPPHAIAIRDRSWRAWFDRPLGDELSVSVYDGDRKLTRQGDQTLRFDLAADPGGLVALPVGDDPLLPALESTVTAARALDGQVLEAQDPALTEALRAIGYVQ